jgi:hypothetical protein
VTLGSFPQALCGCRTSDERTILSITGFFLHYVESRRFSLTLSLLYTLLLYRWAFLGPSAQLRNREGWSETRKADAYSK